MIDSVVTPREGTQAQPAEVVPKASAPVSAGRQSEVMQGNAVASLNTEAGRVAAQLQSTVEETVERVASQVQQINRALKFSVDRDSGYTIVKVIDRDTDELVRQIPSETFLSIARSLQESGQGLFDDSV